MALSNAKLEFWANHRYNVCLSGRHGVGKTGQVVELFNNLYGELGKDWLYFSAANMDPWVDFIGVPEKHVAEDGVSFLHLVRPEIFARDNVKAIFLDEYNRAPKKVRNAVMELIQFGAVNGHKFHTLEVVWTAINPPVEDDEELSYDVDELDPAQLDRFHVFVEVPYKVSKPYFVKKFGKDNGSAAIEWWNALPKKIRDSVSPRRLDYAIDCYQKGGDIRDVLPKGTNVTQLLFLLSEGSIKQNLDDLHKAKDKDAARAKMGDDNFYNMAIEVIKKDKKYLKFFMPLAPNEKLSQFISSSTKADLDKMLDANKKNTDMYEKITEIVEAKGVVNNKVRQLNDWRISNFMGDDDVGDDLMDVFTAEFDTILKTAEKNKGPGENTYHRRQSLQEMISYIKRMPKDVTLSKKQAKTFFDYMLYFVSRSNAPTFGKVATEWKFAMKKVNEMHPFKDNHTRNNQHNQWAKDKLPRSNFIGTTLDANFFQ